MTIAELITKLQAMLAEHGDLPVYCEEADSLSIRDPLEPFIYPHAEDIDQPGVVL